MTSPHATSRTCSRCGAEEGHRCRDYNEVEERCNNVPRTLASATRRIEDFPNLAAILDGRVSGHYTEWPQVRAELKKLAAMLKTWRDRFDDIEDDARILLTHSPKELHGMVEGIRIVAEQSRNSMDAAPPYALSQSAPRIDAATFRLIDAITALVEQSDAKVTDLPGWDEVSLAFHSHPAAHIDVARRSVASSTRELVDLERVKSWFYSKDRKRAEMAFTAGAERQVAYMLEDAAHGIVASAIAPMNDTARLNYLIDRLLSSELAGAIKCDAVYGMDREARLTRTREEIDKQLRATDRTADQRDDIGERS